MTEALARKALAHWGLEGAPVSLVAQRENMVFRVQTPQGDYALRLHRAGLRSGAELRSELQWMSMLGQGGLRVPTPLPTLDGALGVCEGEINIDLLNWLDGAPMGSGGRRNNEIVTAATYHALGGELAKLHELSDQWQRPAGFDLQAWDCDGLLGPEPLWGRFWDNPNLTPSEAEILVRARAFAIDALRRDTHDFGLIHADLVPENVLTGHPIGLIDFNDAGSGYRLFDLATVLNRAARDHDYPEMRAAFLTGYTAARAIDVSALPLFQALRAFTYVGWIVPRMTEPDAQARNQRFIAEAMRYAQNILPA